MEALVDLISRDLQQDPIHPKVKESVAPILQHFDQIFTSRANFIEGLGHILLDDDPRLHFYSYPTFETIPKIPRQSRRPSGSSSLPLAGHESMWWNRSLQRQTQRIRPMTDFPHLTQGDEWVWWSMSEIQACWRSGGSHHGNPYPQWYRNIRSFENISFRLNAVSQEGVVLDFQYTAFDHMGHNIRKMLVFNFQVPVQHELVFSWRFFWPCLQIIRDNRGGHQPNSYFRHEFDADSLFFFMENLKLDYDRTTPQRQRQLRQCSRQEAMTRSLVAKAQQEVQRLQAILENLTQRLQRCRVPTTSGKQLQKEGGASGAN